MTTQTIWTLALAGLITLFAISALVGLGALVRWVFRVNKAASDDEFGRWVDEALRMSETPIYDATAAHIAKHEALGLDREWAEMNGGAR